MKKKCRNRNQRKLTLLLVAALVIMSVTTACSTENRTNSYYDLDVTEHTPDFYINDFAGVFTETQKNELMEKAVAFDQEYAGIQVVITTVESLDETVLGYEYVVEDAEGNRIEDAKQPSNPRFTIEQVAYSMYSQYGIGQDDMGILILFSTGDREVRIETGRQMQFYITDSASGRLLDDYGMDYFAEDKFAEGLISVQTAVIDEIKSHVSADWYTASQETQTDSENTMTSTAANDSTGDSGESTENAATTTETPEEKDSGKGLLWGFFGTIAAAFAAIIALIRKVFQSKDEKKRLSRAWQSERESLEQSKREEIESMRMTFQSALDERERNHEATLSSLKSHYQHLAGEKDDIICELRGDLSDTQQQNLILKAQLDSILDKYNRAQRLHPEHNFEDEVQEMIESEYKAAAQEMDRDLAEVIATPATKDNYDVFNRALSLLDSARPEVKKYVTSDRSVIHDLYYEAIRLRKEFERAEQEKRDKAAAQEAYDRIHQVYEDNPHGNHQTYEALHSALAIFLGLSSAEKAFFPDNKLIDNLKRLHSSAEDDYNDYKEAREAESNVESIIGRMYSADEDDRDKLERAMRYYRALTSAQQEYFSSELLHKLKKLIDEADDDHNRQERRRAEEARRRRAQEEEAARRRRAQQMSSSSFSSSSRSSFGGHGGRPSGGGASRRF